MVRFGILSCISDPNSGLLSQSHDNEAAGPRTQGPEPSAARLGPRALSAGVVVSLGEGFVWINPLDIILKTKTLHKLDLLLTLLEAKEYN